MSAINRKFFFDQVRLTLFHGSLTTRQVQGITAILDYWEAKHAAGDDRWLAYLLGTVYHETDTRMQPIREYGSEARFNRLYSPPPAGTNAALARALGNVKQDDGARFCGRGFVQLTGRRNYTNWGKILEIDLVGQPDLCLDIGHSTAILVEGSIKGSFTGKKLADYFNPATEDWRRARRIINGNDKADLIAGHARRFYAGISYTV